MAKEDPIELEKKEDLEKKQIQKTCGSRQDYQPRNSK